jgi:SPP1 family predicted phage head-tail adaptor
VSGAGNRTRRITIERSTANTDSYGGERPAWSPLADAFAEVLFGTGAERREAAQTQAAMTATFIVPWTPTLAGVVPKDRINGVGAYWNITSAVPVGLNKDIHFTATRNV